MTDIIQEARGLLRDFETESGSIAQAAGGMFFLVDRTAWAKLVHSHYLNQEIQVGHAGKVKLLDIEVELADLAEGEPEIRLLRKPDCTNPARPETITPAALKEFRQRFNLSVADAAAICGAQSRKNAADTWRKWERGAYDIPPHVKIIVAICMHHPGAIDRAAKIAGLTRGAARLAEKMRNTGFSADGVKAGFQRFHDALSGSRGDE